MYVEVPETYEFLNHLLTFWQDIRWRKKAAQLAASSGGRVWLDFGIGTGEMACQLKRLAAAETKVLALDFSFPMMQEALAKPEAQNIHFALAEATRIPLKDNSVDAITISFAARNVDSSGNGNLLKCFEEFCRILNPGGTLVILESSQPRYRLIQYFYHLYVKMTVYPIGRFVSGSKSAYSYLSRSMQRFYSAEQMAEILKQAGFKDVTFKRYMLGATAIHVASAGD